jgi:hypothetical protein
VAFAPLQAADGAANKVDDAWLAAQGAENGRGEGQELQAGDDGGITGDAV